MNVKSDSKSIFGKQVRPIIQAGGAILLLVIIMVAAKLFQPSESAEAIYYWEIGFAILLGFCFFNAIFSYTYTNRLVYFRNSLFCYVLVAGLSGFLAYWFSGISLEESGSFKWLYIVVTFSYLVFISIINAMRKIIQLAKKQDARLRGENNNE